MFIINENYMINKSSLHCGDFHRLTIDDIRKRVIPIKQKLFYMVIIPYGNMLVNSHKNESEKIQTGDNYMLRIQGRTMDGS